MSIPTAVELAQQRDEAELLMPDLVDITDPGGVVITPSGGTDITAPSTTTGVKCRLNRTGTQSTRSEFGEQLTSEADYLMTYEYGTVVQEGWRVTMTSGPNAGLVLTVLSVGKAGSWGTAVRALVVESTAIGG